MAFALSHSTMRARGTREDPSAGHIRSLAVEPHVYDRDQRLWTGAKPPSLQADRLSLGGAYAVSTFGAVIAFFGSCLGL